MRALLVSVVVLGAISAAAEQPEYRRGDQVRVHTVDGQPADPPVQRVIAVPGDRVRIDGERITVNDRPISAISPELVKACRSWDESVPAAHYFLIGEQIQG